ncbi:hypothetical protein [Polyangium spumosum]|uniref:Uncharacterized protein n=1 Tax=Polyangium spumosum TaxID=889282 RepID=A0A6N7Q120_9BACT|nr:hypothetical protein [Polyangium spumosum]MRG96285.1 hypothetical protein [Polyangium spumosum]
MVQPKLPFGVVAARPPHPATVVQPKRPLGALVQRSQAVDVDVEVDSEKGAKFERREQVWEGKRKPVRAVVHVVAPGIGVEVPNDDVSFPLFIHDTLERIRKVPIGDQLIREFHPKRGFRRPAEKLYENITLLIEPMADTQLLETKSFYGRKLDGNWDPGKDRWARTPKIVFPNRPTDKGASLTIGKGKMIGFKAIPSSVKVTPDGITGHDDFPKETCGFEEVLFHEFCHAYYFQIGASPEYYEMPYQVVGMREEMLVCGLSAGRGLEYCENHYRVQSDLPLRTSYKSQGLEDKDVSPEDWPGKTFVHPLTVLGILEIKEAKILTEGTGNWDEAIYP